MKILSDNQKLPHELIAVIIEYILDRRLNPSVEEIAYLTQTNVEQVWEIVDYLDRSQSDFSKTSRFSSEGFSTGVKAGEALIAAINQDPSRGEKMIMSFRYKKQPLLESVKHKWIDRIHQYQELINQDLREKANNLLSEEDQERWGRQILHFAVDQKKIKNTKVAVFGCGGLGSNALLGLIYNGVHKFKILDFDEIELSNLNRQTLYGKSQVGKLKVFEAEKRLLEINPNAEIEATNLKIIYPKDINVFEMEVMQYPEDIRGINEMVKWADYVVNALDHTGSPYLINDLCVKNGKPFIWGGIGFQSGELYYYHPKENTPCLRCIFANPSDFGLKFKFFPNSIKENLEVFRYKVGGGRPGTNLGSVVMIDGILIAELITQDILYPDGTTPFLLLHDEEDNLHTKQAYGCFIIYDGLKNEILKLTMNHDPKCECQKYLSERVNPITDGINIFSVSPSSRSLTKIVNNIVNETLTQEDFINFINPELHTLIRWAKMEEPNINIYNGFSLSGEFLKWLSNLRNDTRKKKRLIKNNAFGVINDFIDIPVLTLIIDNIKRNFMEINDNYEIIKAILYNLFSEERSFKELADKYFIDVELIENLYNRTLPSFSEKKLNSIADVMRISED